MWGELLRRSGSASARLVGMSVGIAHQADRWAAHGSWRALVITANDHRQPLVCGERGSAFKGLVRVQRSVSLTSGALAQRLCRPSGPASGWTARSQLMRSHLVVMGFGFVSAATALQGRHLIDSGTTEACPAPSAVLRIAHASARGELAGQVPFPSLQIRAAKRPESRRAMAKGFRGLSRCLGASTDDSLSSDR